MKRRYVCDSIVIGVGYVRIEIVGRKITSKKTWESVKKRLAKHWLGLEEQ